MEMRKKFSETFTRLERLSMLLRYLERFPEDKIPAGYLEALRADIENERRKERNGSYNR